MTNALPAPDFAPLDEAEYKRQTALLKSPHCARPVMYEGKQRFIHSLRCSETGSRIAMDLYLAGSTLAVDSKLVTTAEAPT